MATTFGKADRAALEVKNIKTKRLNDFYLYHKEILDEYFRLDQEVNEAESNYITANLNSLYDKFPPKRKK